MLIIAKKIYLKELSDEKMVFSQISKGVRLRFYQMHVQAGWVYSWLGKKVFGEYYDIETGKVIPKRKWTSEMESFCEEEIKNIPAQKSKFKLLIGFYVLALFLAFGIGTIVYQNIKSKNRREKMSAKPNVGDLYYGNITFLDNKSPIQEGHLWIKVTQVIKDTVVISFGKNISKEYKDSFKPIPITGFDNKQYKTLIELHGHIPTFKDFDKSFEFRPSEKR